LAGEADVEEALHHDLSRQGTGEGGVLTGGQQCEAEEHAGSGHAEERCQQLVGLTDFGDRRVGSRAASTSSFALSAERPGYPSIPWTLFAFLAAVYLTVEAREIALQEEFRRRALGAAAAVFVAAGGTLALALPSAPLVGRGLSAAAWAWPLHVVTGVAAVAAIGARQTAFREVALLFLTISLAMHP
jgi:hypothetical protein